MIRLVQVFTPVYRLESATIQAVLSLEWDGPLSWLLQRDNPQVGNDRETGRVNILHQYQVARERFLQGRDEALLIVESDIVPPPDALRKLAAVDADCAYGVYRFRVSPVVNIFEKYPGSPLNEGESLSLYPKKLARARAAGVVDCTGGGLGCVLIKRHVLEAISFRLEPKGAHCDSYFNRDVLAAGFSQRAEMSVACGHVTEAGEMLWPF